MPFPCNQLEQALLALRSDETRGDDLLNAIAVGHLWVPLPQGGGAEDASLPITVIDGTPYVVVYTSEEQLERGAGRVGFAMTPGRDFVRSLPAELGLAVNPGGELGLPLPANALRTIRGEEHQLTAGSKITLGEPVHEPEILLDALRSGFTGVPGVLSARRAWAMTEESSAGFLLLGIEVDPDDQQGRRQALDM